MRTKYIFLYIDSRCLQREIKTNFQFSYALLSHLESWQPGVYRHIPSYTRYMTPYPMPCHMGSYTWYMRVYTFFKSIWRVYTCIYFSPKGYDVIWQYRYITVYDDSWPSYVSIWRRFSTYTGRVFGIRPLISGTCLLILPNCCFQMLSWLVYACSSCSALFPAAPGWPAWMLHICCTWKAR